jgi:uncharacterized membrane protein YeaQ/YmgE (transglycosylase-associated protein family)
MDSPESWLDFLGRIALGASAGGLGAFAREVTENDRELSLALLPKIVAGLCAGSAAVSVSQQLGLDSLFSDWSVSMVAGFIGQAAVMDLVRQWLKRRGFSLPPKAEGGA